MSTSITNPGTWMKGTTWERYAKGRVLVGVNEDDSDFTIGKSGGEKTKSLRVLLGWIEGDISKMGQHMTIKVPNIDYNYAWQPTGGMNSTSRVVPNSTINHSTMVADTEGNTSIPILQPYISIYIWRRTA